MKESDQLKAMRWVAGHIEGTERSQLERACRQWFLDDFRQFMAKLADLERAHEASASKEPVKPEKVAEKDEGTEQVAEIMAEEWERAKRFRAAEVAGGERVLPLVAPAEGGGKPA